MQKKPPTITIQTRNGCAQTCPCAKGVKVAYKNLLWHLPVEKFDSLKNYISKMSESHQTQNTQAPIILATGSQYLMATVNLDELIEIDQLMSEFQLAYKRELFTRIYNTAK